MAEGDGVDIGRLHTSSMRNTPERKKSSKQSTCDCTHLIQVSKWCRNNLNEITATHPAVTENFRLVRLHSLHRISWPLSEELKVKQCYCFCLQFLVLGMSKTTNFWDPIDYRARRCFQCHMYHSKSWKEQDQLIWLKCQNPSTPQSININMGGVLFVNSMPSLPRTQWRSSYHLRPVNPSNGLCSWKALVYSRRSVLPSFPVSIGTPCGGSETAVYGSFKRNNEKSNKKTKAAIRTIGPFIIHVFY